MYECIQYTQDRRVSLYLLALSLSVLDLLSTSTSQHCHPGGTWGLGRLTIPKSPKYCNSAEY